MTDEQLSEIEARANAATPGPWEADDRAAFGERVVRVSIHSHPENWN